MGSGDADVAELVVEKPASRVRSRASSFPFARSAGGTSRIDRRGYTRALTRTADTPFALLPRSNATIEFGLM